MDMGIITSTTTILNPAVNSAISNVLSDLLQVALLALTTGIGWAVKVWLSSMKSSWKQTIALRLVSYAEQKITGNPEKLKYVAEQLNKHFPRISTDEANHLIEEAVVNLKSQLKPS
jgi:hypothetical protein